MSAWDDRSAPRLAFPVPEPSPSWSQPSSAFPSYAPFPLPPVPAGYVPEEEAVETGFFSRIPATMVVVLGAMVGALLAVGIIVALNPPSDGVPHHRMPATIAKDTQAGVIVKPMLAPLHGTAPAIADVDGTVTIPAHRRAVHRPPARRTSHGHGRPTSFFSVGIGG